ncbi:MAG: SpoIIE family protein phosphatase [Acidobacteriota bacterium]|nr:SpoIIE family protein phosphatase [Acidobacteriota bacterium]
MTRIGRIVRVTDASEVASARRIARQCTEALRLSETAAGKAALLATELATNLVKHGGGGSILLGSDFEDDGALILIAIDKGRGIQNVNLAMRDGFSTAGSPGTGLGAIRRAASQFDVYTLPDRGTAVFCRIEDEVTRAPRLDAPSRVTVGGICVPLPSEEQPGDAWMWTPSRDGALIAVADGLGHGDAAATASTAAVRVFAERAEEPLEAMMQDAHGALRPTRGAAVGIARIHATHGRLDFAGVGNIAGTITDDESARRVVSLNGIVGHEMRKVQTFSYPWTASSVLVMQSDGVSANWNASAYPGLLQREPALIAAVIYRDYCRGNDDATVVVAKAS